MTTSRVLAPAFGAGLLFTLTPAGEKVTFHPESGSSLQKSFVITGEYSLDQFDMVVDGQDLGAQLGSFEMTLDQETKIEVTDNYAAVGEGRPTRLLRTFDALGSTTRITMSGPVEIPEQPEIKAASELEGKTVVFQWDEKKGVYDASYPEGQEGEDKLLEGLHEDMDLRAFLPTSEVAAEDTWTVELKELQALYMPGGDMAMLPDMGAEVDEEQMSMFRDMFKDFGTEFSDLFEGDCTCALVGVREEDGQRMAEIGITIVAAATVDLTELIDKAIHAAMEQFGGEAPDIALDQADLNVDFEGHGTLLWDVKAGRAHSLSLAGDVTMSVELGVSIETEEDGSHSVEASVELSGTLQEEIGTKE